MAGLRQEKHFCNLFGNRPLHFAGLALRHVVMALYGIGSVSFPFSTWMFARTMSSQSILRLWPWLPVIARGSTHPQLIVF